LKFQGGSSYSCPISVAGGIIANNVTQKVEVKAETIGVVPVGSSLYTSAAATSISVYSTVPGNAVRRQLRGNGEDGRELTWCTNNGCPPNNPYQYCTIIGCNRRRELPVVSSVGIATLTPACPDLVASARAEFTAQAAYLKSIGSTCSNLFSNFTISCQE
jgi:hypothetical protein